MNKTAPWHRAFASRHRHVRPDRRRLAVYRGRVVSVADRVTSTTVSGQHGYTSVNSVPEVWIADAHGQELRFIDVTLTDCRAGHEVVIVGDPAKDKVLSMRNLSTKQTWFSSSLTDLPFNGSHLFSMIPTAILFCGIASFISFAMFGEAWSRRTWWEQTAPDLMFYAALALGCWLPEMGRTCINHRNEALRVRIRQELEAASK